jgi:predicted DNA-binding transcriptional regulator YafY
MPRNFSRHEQFLRIFALLEILSTARQPLDDQALIAQLKERLGLSRLSTRTLHRDCDFLVSCGYPIDHLPMTGNRRFGWRLEKSGASGRQIPAEPITLLELTAFMVGRDLLRTFEGTILWSGIESLRHKVERSLPPGLLERLEGAKQVFHVRSLDPAKFAGRPRLLSTLSAAITDCREIDLEERGADGSVQRRRLQPLRLVIRPPQVQLLGCAVDLERIEKVQPLDATFKPPPFDAESFLAGG